MLIETKDTRLIWPDRTLAHALSAIEFNVCRDLIVVNQDLTVIGSITEGDIRRSLLSGKELSSPVSGSMNAGVKCFNTETDISEIYKELKVGKTLGRRLYPFVDIKTGQLLKIIDANYENLIPISEPFIGKEEAENVLECLRTNWISSIGPFVEQFECELAKVLQLENALAVSNGTSAITIALMANKVGSFVDRDKKPPSEIEVIVPSLTFAGTANAVIMAGATPVFADVDRDSWGLSVASLAEVAGPRTRAVVLVHLYGNPSDAKEIAAWCKGRDIVLIEDCAEALGTKVGRLHAGSFGDASTFSFFGNKTISTGEGGMVFFKKAETLATAQQIRNQGMNSKLKYYHDTVGANFRLTNLQASIGVAQTSRLSQAIEHKKQIAETYSTALAATKGLKIMNSSPFGECSYWLVPILLENELSAREFQIQMASRGIEVRPVFPPLHLMPPYRDYRRAKAMTNSLLFAAKGLCLPSYLGLSNEDLGRVIKAVKEAILHS